MESISLSVTSTMTEEGKDYLVFLNELVTRTEVWFNTFEDPISINIHQTIYKLLFSLSLLHE